MMLSAQTQSRLAGLRSKIRFLFLMEGLAVALIALCGAILVTLGLDYALRGPVLFRLFINLIALGLLAYVVYRFLVYPLMVKMTVDDMALYVEKGFPGLRDSLISALQLGRKFDPSDTYSSSTMVKALVSQTEEVARRMDFGRVIGPSRGSTGFFTGAFLALALVACGFAFVPGMMYMFTERVLLLKNTPYPEPWTASIDNEKEIEWVPQQCDVTINVTMNHTSGDPNKVYDSALRVEYYVTEDGVRKLRSKDFQKTEGNHFSARLQIATSDVDFSIRGSRVRDNSYKIQTVARPEIAKVTCVVEPPRYTLKKAVDMPMEGLNVLRGSRVFIDIWTKEPTASAYITFFRGKDKVGRSVPLETTPESPNDLTWRRGGFFAEESLSFKIVVQDSRFANDLRFTNLNPVEYNLNVRGDAAPKIEMVTPSRSNILRVEKAYVPIHAIAEDDVFPTRVELWLQVIAPKLVEGLPAFSGIRVIPLYGLQRNRWTVQCGDPLDRYLPSIQPKNDITSVLDLGGLPLQPGSRVALMLRVMDSFDNRHLEAAKPRLEMFAISLFLGEGKVTDLWSAKRIDLPEEMQDRLRLAMYEGMIQVEQDNKEKKDTARIEDYNKKARELRVKILGNLINRLNTDRENADNESRWVDAKECAAKIAKARWDIAIARKASDGDVAKARLDVAIAQKASDEDVAKARLDVAIAQKASDDDVAKAWQEFDEAVNGKFDKDGKLLKDGFKQQVAGDVIFAARDQAWAVIDSGLLKKAADYYASALEVKATEAGSAASQGKFADLQADFDARAKALQAERVAVYNALKKADVVSMAKYVELLRNLTMPSQGYAFRDQRPLEDLEEIRMQSPPADNSRELFLLYAKMYAKVEEEIARKLQYVDMLQYRTTELNNEDFAKTWADLGMFDSIDLKAMYTVVHSRAFEENMKKQDVEQKKIAALNEKISILKQRIRDYAAKQGKPDPGFATPEELEESKAEETAPATPPKPEPPAPAGGGAGAPSGAGGMMLSPDSDIKEEGEPGGGANPPAGGGTENPPAGGNGQTPPAAGAEGDPDLIDVVDDAAQATARIKGLLLTLERDDLNGALIRYDIYSRLEESIGLLMQWVGPNFSDSEQLQLNIVSKEDKQDDLLKAILEFGDKFGTNIVQVEVEECKGAYDRYNTLTDALAAYKGSDPKKLQDAIKMSYPGEAKAGLFDSDKFVNQDGSIKTEILAAEMKKRADSEFVRAWAGQKKIEKDLPELTKMAEDIVEEFNNNGFKGYEAIDDFIRPTETKVGEHVIPRGVIPILKTLEKVSAPELTVLTDELRSMDVRDPKPIVTKISDIVMPKQQKFIEEANTILRIVDKYGGMVKLIKQVQELAEMQKRLRELIEQAGETGGDVEEGGGAPPAAKPTVQALVDMLVKAGWAKADAEKKVKELKDSGATEDEIKKRIENGEFKPPVPPAPPATP